MTLPPLKLRILVVSLFATSFLGALDHTIVSTSLSTIAGELGALQQMSWVVVAYTLAATVSLPVLGKLADTLGPRRVFLASLTTFLLASLACGFAPDMTWLIVARVVQGLSSAGLQLMSQTIIGAVTSPRERPRLMSIIGSAFPVAIVVGPLLGGIISDTLGWQWVFWINVPLGAAALVLASVAVPHLGERPRGRIDVPGALTFTTAMVALVLAVTWFPDERLRPASLALLATAVVVFGVFALVERRAQQPFLPFGIFRNRTVAAGITLSAVIGIGLFSVVSYIPTFIQMAYRTSATVSGLVPIATVLGMLVASLATGFRASRTGRYRRWTIAGPSVAAAGLVVMAFLPVGLPLWAPMLVMGVVGLGTGAFMNLILAVVQGAVPRGDLGLVTATSGLVRQVGATVGTAIIGGVIAAGVVALLPAGLNASTLTPDVAHAASPAVQAQIAAVYQSVMSPVFLALAGVYAVGVVAAIMFPQGRLSTDTASVEAQLQPETV